VLAPPLPREGQLLASRGLTAGAELAAIRPVDSMTSLIVRRKPRDLQAGRHAGVGEGNFADETLEPIAASARGGHTEHAAVLHLRRALWLGRRRSTTARAQTRGCMAAVRDAGGPLAHSPRVERQPPDARWAAP